jgi:hypothetical protein
MGVINKEATTMKKMKTTKSSKAAAKTAGAVVEPDMDNYKIGLAKTASGRATIDIGDETAAALRGKPLDEVYKLAAKVLGESEKDLHARYDHLNPGMQRMNLGNRMRAAAKTKSEKATAPVKKARRSKKETPATN